MGPISMEFISFNSVYDLLPIFRCVCSTPVIGGGDGGVCVLGDNLKYNKRRKHILNKTIWKF